MTDDAKAKPPAAYELKRLVAAQPAAFWRSDIIVGLPTAPIYLFPDQEAFDGDEVAQLSRRIITDPLRLPHSNVIYEVVDAQNAGRSSVVYARQADVTIDAVLFVRPRQSGRWTDSICHARYQQDGSGTCELNPRFRAFSTKDALHILQGMLIRATALIMAEACGEEVHLSRLRRMMLAKPGVAGWSYRLASLDLSKLRRSTEPKGGSHASPRWHIRRGHWRRLAEGRRVFVRGCEVGDAARGGVVKDYQVQLGAEA